MSLELGTIILSLMKLGETGVELVLEWKVIFTFCQMSLRIWTQVEISNE